jgi:hypothetical protein
MSQLKFFNSFNEFVKEMQDNFPETKDILTQYAKTINEITPRSDAVNNVLTPFRRFSRNILIHDPDMFSQELVCLGGIDLSNLYNNTDNTSKRAIQQYLETLYISGNICLKPHKKKQFLQAVTKIKSKYPTPTAAAAASTQIGRANGGGAPVPPLPAGIFNDDSIQNAMSQLQGMFGNSGIMGELLGDVTKTVGSALKNNDPNQLLQDMLSGDMSKFGDVFGQLDAKYGERLKNEPIDENQLMEGASRVMEGVTGQSGGNPMDMMGMMQGLMSGRGEGGAGGGPDMMGMMQGLMGGGGNEPIDIFADDEPQQGGIDMLGMMQGLMNGMKQQSGGDGQTEGGAPPLDMMGMMQGLMQGLNTSNNSEEGIPSESMMSMLSNLMQPPTQEVDEVHDVKNSPYFSQTIPDVNDESKK